MHYCGWLSDSVNSGIHLGCPFPPLAFVLAIELLTIKIRDVQKLKGIRNWSLNNVPIYKILLRLLCMQMMLFFFLNDENDMRHALNVIHEFSIFSG